jgi:CBS-domain-containing membrane protein
MSMEHRQVHPGAADRQKLAAVDTVRSVLESKGGQVWQIAPDATVFQAIAQMAEHSIGALPVVLGESLVGIISERDYARKVILQGRSSRDTLVREIMTPSPVVITPEATVEECLQIMNSRRFRHLPVIEEGRVAGIVSIGDLVRALIATQAFTIHQLHTYIVESYPV